MAFEQSRTVRRHQTRWPSLGVFLSVLAPLSVLAALWGCGTVRDNLDRAVAHYEDARYEACLSWLDALEPELPAMAPDLRARFYYLRGMTAYRLGARRDATHYLALARESSLDASDSLPSHWRANLNRTLATLIQP